MPYEMLVGIQVIDDDLYRHYREAMRPILQEHGGGFRHDFMVNKVLASESDAPINRVFTIHFADHDAKERFFAHPEYVKIRNDFFEPSVAEVTILAEYERSATP